MREFESRETISFGGFYARRIKRILPAGLFVIGATLCATRVLAGIDRYHFAAKDAISAVLFSANWHFAHTGVNYFNQSLPPSPLQHYWSLSVEEQFYFVWPWLMLGLLPRRPAPAAVAPRARASGGRRRDRGDLRRLAGVRVRPDRRQPDDRLLLHVRPGLGARPGSAPRHRRGHGFAGGDARVRVAVAWLGLLAVLVSLVIVPTTSGVPAPWLLLPTLWRRRRARRRRGPIAPGAGAAHQSGQPVPGQDLLQPVPLALPGGCADRRPGPAVLGGVLAGGPGVDLRPLGGVVSPARGPRPARHLVSPPPGTRADARCAAGCATRAACAATALIAAAGLLVVRSMSPARLVLRTAGPRRPHPGRPRATASGRRRLTPVIAALRLNAGNRVAPLPGELPDDTGGAYACYAYLGQPAHPCEYGSRRRHAIRVALIGDSHAAALLAVLEPQLRRAQLARHRLHRPDVRLDPGAAGAAVPGAGGD